MTLRCTTTLSAPLRIRVQPSAGDLPRADRRRACHSYRPHRPRLHLSRRFLILAGRTMKFIQRVLAGGVVLSAMGGLLTLSARATRSDPNSWDPKTAAAYMDGRAAWWMDWPTAARDHGTFCISCHTAAPYAIARPALRPLLHEQGPSAVETRLVDNVGKRVSLWNEVAPF